MYFEPKILPILTPAAENANVTTPINETAGIIETLKKANVTPTASASIYVATAIRNIFPGFI